MTDQQARDLICVVLIGAVIIMSWTGHAVPDQIRDWADTAFGFLFGAKTASYFIGGKPNGQTTNSPIAPVKP